MPFQTNETHDPGRRSWVDSASEPGADFPIQNLPYGVFRGSDGTSRIGVAIGDQVLDVRGVVEEQLLEGLTPETACSLCATDLNQFMARGREAWATTRRAIADLLDAGTPRLRDDADRRGRLLRSIDRTELLLPATIGDYTDFYASIHHATNVGSMFRPDNPLLPNYRHLPVGYHGRASSIVVSGTAVRRPCGQTKADDAAEPVFGPSRLLDYELEMGVFIGPGNPMGRRVTIEQAPDQIFGMVIVNDWSARDVQKWEYQPLGPFNAKNFATTVSPWIVTAEALAPFRIPGPPRGPDDPPIIDYLRPRDDATGHWGLDIAVEVHVRSAAMREAGQDASRVSRGSFREMYWTIAQMIAHHSSTGCNLRPGDLLASGTVSGPDPGARGCLLELTWRGQNPIDLPDGSQRRFLQDGDEVTIRAVGEAEGAVAIGFGTCTGVIEPASV